MKKRNGDKNETKCDTNHLDKQMTKDTTNTSQLG